MTLATLASVISIPNDLWKYSCKIDLSISSLLFKKDSLKEYKEFGYIITEINKLSELNHKKYPSLSQKMLF